MGIERGVGEAASLPLSFPSIPAFSRASRMMKPLMKIAVMKMTCYVHFSGSHKRYPLPGTPKMSWETTATYGAMSPLWFGRGNEHVAQRANIGQFYPGSGHREA